MVMQKSGAKPSQNRNNKNPLETIKDLGGGMLDQFFGNESGDNGEFKGYPQAETKQKSTGKKEFKLFNYTEYSETTLIKRKIAELTELIKKEIDFLKKDNSALLS